jgi:hypothetical protein
MGGTRLAGGHVVVGCNHAPSKERKEDNRGNHVNRRTSGSGKMQPQTGTC